MLAPLLFSMYTITDIANYEFKPLDGLNKFLARISVAFCSNLHKSLKTIKIAKLQAFIPCSKFVARL